MKRNRSLLFIIIAVFILCSCNESHLGGEDIVGKWQFGYVLHEGISHFNERSNSVDTVILFTKDNKVAFSIKDLEYNGTWEEVPTVDDNKTKYHVSTEHGDNDFYMDRSESNLLYATSTDGDLVYFVKDVALIDAEKERSYKKAQELIANNEYLDAILVLKEIKDYKESKKILLTAYVQVENYEDALKIATELGDAEAEEELTRLVKVEKSIKEGDFETALSVAYEIGDKDRIEEIQLLILKQYIDNNDYYKAERVAEDYGNEVCIKFVKQEKFKKYVAEENFKDAARVAAEIGEDYEKYENLAKARDAETQDLKMAFELYNKVGDDYSKERMKKNQVAYDMIGTYKNTTTGDTKLIINNANIREDGGIFIKFTYDGLSGKGVYGDYLWVNSGSHFYTVEGGYGLKFLVKDKDVARGTTEYYYYEKIE